MNFYIKNTPGSRVHRYDENTVHCTYYAKSRRKKDRVSGKEGKIE